LSAFQIVGLGLALAVVAVLAWSVLRRGTHWRTALPWAVLWTATGLAFAWPESIAHVARGLGVRRGADLVSYVAVLGTLVGFFWFWLRLRHMNRHITLLVRQVALEEAAREYAGSDGSTPEVEP